MIPPALIVEHILPFLDRETYDSCLTLNKEVHTLSTVASHSPWPTACLNINEEVTCVAFDSSNEAFACGCANGDVSLWNKQGKRQATMGHSLPVLSLAFSPTKDWLASGSADCSIRLWRLKDLVPTCESMVLVGHRNPVHSIAFLPNSYLASAAHEPFIRIWDLSTEKCIACIPRSEKVESLAVSPSGRLIATATWDGSIQLFELSDTAYRIINVEMEKALPLTKLHFSQDGKYLYGVKGFRVRRWNVEDGSLNCLSGCGVHRVYSVAISPQANLVAYGDFSGTIQMSPLTNEKERTPQAPKKLYGHYHQCVLAFAPRGRTILSGGEDGVLRLWSV